MARKVTPIFTSGKYFVAHVDNTISSYDTYLEAVAGMEEPTDVLLIASEHRKGETKKSTKIEKAKKIVLDFNKNILTIKGAPDRIKDTRYVEGDNALTAEDLKGWQKLMTDARKTADEFELVGVPPIEGECLDNLLKEDEDGSK